MVDDHETLKGIRPKSLSLEERVLVVEVSASLVRGLGSGCPEDELGEPLVADLEPVLTSVQLVHLLLRQLETVELQVVLDTRRSDGLGDDRDVLALSSLHVPDQQDLLGRSVVLLGNLLQGLVVGQRRTGGSETRVGGEVDTLGLAEVDEGGRGTVDVGLTLVDGGDGLGRLQKGLQVLDTEVGDTDGLDLGRGDLLHLPPGVDKVPVLVEDLLVLTVDGVDRDGPVHQDQVDVVGLELLKRLVDDLGDVLVLHVVDLGGQEDLLSRNTRVDDTVTDLGLVSVSLGGVNVPVSGLESSLDGGPDLVGSGLPCTQTEDGHLGTGVEGGGDLGPSGGRHFERVVVFCLVGRVKGVRV